MHKSAKKNFRFMWFTYKALSVSFFTLILLFGIIRLSSLLGPFTYIELPNGARLTQPLLRNTGSNGFVLEAPNGDFVLEAANNSEVAWQGDYVFGMGHMKSRHDDGDGFIYKIGWEKPLLFKNVLLPTEKYGLSGSIDYSPELFESEGYKKCVRFYGTNECKFRTLDQYRQDLDDGKIKPYKCKRKNKNDACHSYSIYKTYLSLKKMKKYRR